MTVVLLCGAGLLVRTVVALNNVSHGFEPRGLVTMRVVLSPTRYPGERSAAFFRDALDAIRELPGVESAAAATSLPVVGGSRAGTSFHRRGTPIVPRSEMPGATIRVVTPGYFRTLRIPVLRGREFTAADDANPVPGFIVNEEFVKARLAGVDPLSESLMVRMQDENPYGPIIGVVGDVSERSVKGEARPTIYYSHRQLSDAGLTLFVRSNQPAAAAEQAVGVIRRLDPNVPVTQIRTFEEALAEQLIKERLSALVSGAFAVSGLLLAALGLVCAARIPRHGAHARDRASHRARCARAELTWSVVRMAFVLSRSARGRRRAVARRAAVFRFAALRSEADGSDDICGCADSARGCGGARVVCAGTPCGEGGAVDGVTAGIVEVERRKSKGERRKAKSEKRKAKTALMLPAPRY